MQFKVIVKKDSGENFDESVDFLEAEEAINFIKAYSALIKSAQQSVQRTCATSRRKDLQIQIKGSCWSHTRLTPSVRRLSC